MKFYLCATARPMVKTAVRVYIHVCTCVYSDVYEGMYMYFQLLLVCNMIFLTLHVLRTTLNFEEHFDQEAPHRRDLRLDVRYSSDA